MSQITKKCYTYYMETRKDGHINILNLLVGFAAIAVVSFTIFSINTAVQAHKNRAGLHCYQYTTQSQAQLDYNNKKPGYKTLYVNDRGQVCTSILKRIK